MAAYLLGIDLGTSGVRVLLIDEKGKTVASATGEYPLSQPRPLWAEQDPDQWWEQTAKAIRAVLAQAGAASPRIAAIGLSGQMHGLVLLDREARVPRPAILWNDQRTASQCAAITRRLGEKELLKLTGNPVLPGFTAPKILWVRENEPEVYSRVERILLPKDFIRQRLTGAYCGDVSDASGTSLFDVGRRAWSRDVLRDLEIPVEWLPQVTESTEVSARVSHEAAKLTGLTEGTPVVGGAGDQAAQAVGSGIIDEGTASVTLGTSGVVFAVSDRFRIEPEGKLHAFCHAVPGKWHLMGVMLSAAGAFRWFRDAFGQSEIEEAQARNLDPYDLLTEQAAGVPAGCGGLLFLPYLSGERTPHPDPDARGVFFGINLSHGKPHFTRAVLEGVAFGLRDSLGLLRAAGVAPSELRVSGGGARSQLWKRILADVLGLPLVTTNAEEGAAFGAALLAGTGTGVFADVDAACRTTLRETGRIEPGADALVYPKYYDTFRALYPALAVEFNKAAARASPD